MNSTEQSIIQGQYKAKYKTWEWCLDWIPMILIIAEIVFLAYFPKLGW